MNTSVHQSLCLLTRCHVTSCLMLLSHASLTMVDCTMLPWAKTSPFFLQLLFLGYVSTAREKQLGQEGAVAHLFFTRVSCWLISRSSWQLTKSRLPWEAGLPPRCHYSVSHSMSEASAPGRLSCCWWERPILNDLPACWHLSRRLKCLPSSSLPGLSFGSHLQPGAPCFYLLISLPPLQLCPAKDRSKQTVGVDLFSRFTSWLYN